ncbi:diacylglycerol kinase family protein [Sphingobium fluviale]|nr:diacylglycerol kinase family protein [Sphingobium fluviale]
MRPLLARRSSPLAWRPSSANPVSGSFAIRAAGRLESFAHAFDGWRFLVRNEPNMRIHLGIATLATLMGTWLRIGPSEWRWLIVAMTTVLAIEALNTAVEQACNAISRSYNPAIKAAKDVAAGAVLIAALAAALIGASVFLPHLRSADHERIILPTTICGETG